MNISRKMEVTIVLHLTTREATYLRDLLQNPTHDAETDQEEMLREQLFHGLREALS